MKNSLTDSIIAALNIGGPMKARELAKQLGTDKKTLNHILYGRDDTFVCNTNYEWSLIEEHEIKVVFGKRWVNGASFEETLIECGCLLTSNCNQFRIIIQNRSFIFLEASARLLALSNQMAEIGKSVTIDFSDNNNVYHFLNRNGFLDHLDKRINVVPRRPRKSSAQELEGKNNTLFEIRSFAPENKDDKIPIQLTKLFEEHAGPQYYHAAFTIIAELYKNVCDHSKTPTPGLVALQSYQGARTPHIQTVVSDSGVGIIGALKPILKKRYPDLAEEFDLKDQKSSLKLIRKIFEEGKITSRRKELGGGGTGLMSSRNHAKKFNARISIRQATSELTLSYLEGAKKVASYKTDLPPNRRNTCLLRLFPQSLTTS